MIETINITKDKQFVIDLILQRTGPFLSMGGGQAFQQWGRHGNREVLFEFLNERNLVNQFLQEVQEGIDSEAESLLNDLPASSLKSIVSIGPGNGMLELSLLKYVNNSKILLIDIEQTAEHHHGYCESGAGYANLKTTKDFLISNGIKNKSISLCNPKKESLPEFKFTLLISTLSMGFHYPCDEYIDFIERNSLEKSMIVIDKRKNVVDDGFEKLKKNYSINNSWSYPKSTRVFLRKERI
jgi:hypothetical protein